MHARLSSRFPLFAAALLTVAVSLPGQDEWPMYQANSAHTGYLPVTVNPQTMVPRWTAQLASSGFVNPVTVADDKVYVTGPDRKLRVLDASSGVELWSRDFTGAFSVNPPSYENGRVYVQTGNHSNDTYLRCYDADTGALVFQSPHAAQWENYRAPTIRDGVVYVNGGYYGGMYAFRATDGQQLWFESLAQYDRWTPAVDDTRAYAYVGGNLTVHDRNTGAEVFRINDPNFQWQGWSMRLAPVLGGANDLFAVQAGRLIRFDLQGRNIAYEIPGGFAGQPAVENGVVYTIFAGSLQARDQANGSLLWSWGDPTEQLANAVALTQGHAIVGSNGKTFMIDLQTHQSVWSFDEGGHLSLGEGALYIARADGNLTAIGFANLPTPLSLSPDYAHYTATPLSVTIRGTGFAVGGTVEVKFGGTPAANVLVVDDQTITCDAPARDAGRVDVTVENSNGRGVLEGGFTYTPAVEADGNLHPGGMMHARFYQAPHEMVLGFLGFAPRARIAMPPLLGEREIDPYITLFFLPSWPSPRFDLMLPIPQDPNLSGTTVLIQGVAGSDLYFYNGAFSNCWEFTIQ